MKKEGSFANTSRHILKGLRNVFIVDVILLVALFIVAVVVALTTGNSIGKCMYLACYYSAIFILLVSIPQFYKRNEASKHRKIRQMDTMFGFYGWFGNKYNDDIMSESFEDFKGDGFWMGIMLVTVGTVLLAVGVILENIFFI